MPDRSELRVGEFLLTYPLRGHSLSGQGKSWQCKHVIAGHIVSAVRKPRKMSAGALLTSS